MQRTPFCYLVSKRHSRTHHKKLNKRSIYSNRTFTYLNKAANCRLEYCDIVNVSIVIPSITEFQESLQEILGDKYGNELLERIGSLEKHIP